MWRDRDSNPGYAMNVNTLSKRAPSATRPPLQIYWLKVYNYFSTSTSSAFDSSLTFGSSFVDESSALVN